MSRLKLNQRNIDKLAQELVQDVAQSTQKGIDRVYRSHHGSDVNRVERALERELRNGPVTYGRDTLQGWAQLIADNTPIRLRTR